jgi:hypothetical protein
MLGTTRLLSGVRALIGACLAAGFLCGDVSAVTLTATYDSWIRSIDNDDVNLRDNDYVSVASATSGYGVRWGVVEFDLSGIGVPITEAHLRLWHQPNGFGDDCCGMDGFATLIDGTWANPAGGGSAGVGLLDWTDIVSAEGSGTSLTSLGTVNVGAATAPGDYVSSSSTGGGDITALNVDRLGDQLATFVLRANEVGDNRNSWGDDSTFRAQLVINEGIPLTPSDLELHINRFTGETRMVSVDGLADVDLDKYRLQTFPAVPEDIWLPGSWNSLTDQSAPGWAETSATNQVLEETNGASFTAIPAGGSLSVGNAYDVTKGTSFVGFSYSVDGDSSDVNGSVIFDGAGLRLRVAKATGRVDIVNTESAGIDFESYSIQSPDNELSVGGWDSLENQSVSGWQESNPSTSSLIELNLSSSTVVPGNGALVLGNAYSGGAGGNETLAFEFDMVGSGGIFDGAVEYLLLGDMNGDGSVTTADASLFVEAIVNRMAYDAHGHATGAGYLVDADASGDINGDGRLDIGDSAAFSALLGGPASAAGVPEPGSLVLWCFAILIWFGRRRP